MVCGSLLPVQDTRNPEVGAACPSWSCGQPRPEDGRVLLGSRLLLHPRRLAVFIAGVLQDVLTLSAGPNPLWAPVRTQKRPSTHPSSTRHNNNTNNTNNSSITVETTTLCDNSSGVDSIIGSTFLSAQAVSAEWCTAAVLRTHQGPGALQLSPAAAAADGTARGGWAELVGVAGRPC